MDVIDKEDRRANRMAMIVARSAHAKPGDFKKTMKEIG